MGRNDGVRAMASYVIGVDFGTLSGRAILVERSGRIAAESVMEYPHGVMTERGPGWALHDPADYLRVLEGTIPALLRESGVPPEDVAAVSWDVTASTMLPVKEDGRPLCQLPELQNEPHAYVKLWKHLAAAPQAQKIEEAARRTEPGLLDDYGGKVASQWMLPKLLQIAEEAPQVFAAADLFLEVGDWLTLVLTGTLARSACGAGFKSFWSRERGYPSRAFLGGLHPLLASLPEKQLRGPVIQPWGAAGRLTETWAARLGLRPGTVVAAGIIDAHAGILGCGATERGALLMSVGTSTCHLLLSDEKRPVAGICGVVKDSVLPELYAYEAGQACVGDLLDWFTVNCVPARESARARERGLSLHGWLCEQARLLPPGANGLVALDWWNGQRSPYVDDQLSGLMLGMTLRTTPAEQYRALMESTAYGSRLIVDTFENAGVSIEKLTVCGGISKKNPLMMQIYADVLNRPIQVAAQTQTAALGAAILAASAGGLYDGPAQAAAAMTRPPETSYQPNADHAARYAALYAIYRALSDRFAAEPELMHALHAMRTT